MLSGSQIYEFDGPCLLHWKIISRDKFKDVNTFGFKGLLTITFILDLVYQFTIELNKGNMGPPKMLDRIQLQTLKYYHQS